MQRRKYIARATACAVLLIFTGAVQLATAQTAELDLNEHYKFPFSFGVEYQNLSPISDYGNDASANEISGVIRYPIPSLPVIQPMLQLGAMRFNIHDDKFPDRWDHVHLFGVVGAGYMTRFTKTFEFGGELGLGYSHGIFANIDPNSEQAYASPSLLLTAGGQCGTHPLLQHEHQRSSQLQVFTFIFVSG